MPENLVAKAEQSIDAPPVRVWEALTDLTLVSSYYFGTELETDWRVGSPMTFRGNWEGKPYEDHGRVLVFEPPRHVAYAHWSPASGGTEAEAHRLDFTLAPEGDGTHVTLTQGGNADEAARKRSEGMWRQLLDGLRRVAEDTGAHTQPTVVDGGTDRDTSPGPG